MPPRSTNCRGLFCTRNYKLNYYMALRLQDSEEDKTHFVRGLPGPYRAFYFWLKRACDHAGIWEIDIDEARMRTGFFELEADTAAELFTKKIIKLPCGEKFFLIDFAAEQLKTTELNFANTYHRGVINIFNKLDIFNLTTLYSIKETKPLLSSLQATKDKSKDMEIDKDMDKVISKETREEILIIENSPELLPKKSKANTIPKEQQKTFLTPLVQAFRDFSDMRVKKKSALTERAKQMIHTELEKLAPGDDEMKIAILNQSTKNSWTDVWPIKSKGPDTVKGKLVDMSSVAKYEPVEA